LLKIELNPYVKNLLFISSSNSNFVGFNDDSLSNLKYFLYLSTLSKLVNITFEAQSIALIKLDLPDAFAPYKIALFKIFTLLNFTICSQLTSVCPAVKSKVFSV